MIYSLYVPFEFPSNGSINDPLPYAGVLMGYSATILQNTPYYAIEVRGLESEYQATDFLVKLELALQYAAVELRTAVRIKRNLREVYYPDDPETAARNMGFSEPRKIDAIIDGGQSAIYPEGIEISRLTGQRASCSFGYPSNKIFEECNKLLSSGDLIAAGEGRLRLALDVHSYSKFEVSGAAARFVLLWTVIELLAEAPSRKPMICTTRLLNAWKDECDRELTNHERTTAEWSELKKLRARLDDFETESISQQVMRYILATVGNDDLASGASIKSVRRLNAARGKIVHNGETEIGQELSELEDLVLALLKSEIQACRTSSP